MSRAFRELGAAVLSAASLLGLVCNDAVAADMPMPAPMVAADNQMMEFGSGWYLRGDIGISQEKSYQLGSVALNGNTGDGRGFPNTWQIGGGFGYKYNDWFRTDVTLDWHAPRSFRGNTQKVTCITGAGLDPVTNERFDYTDDCRDDLQMRVNNLTLLFNGYIDLGKWYGFTPYVGAGIGANFGYQKFNQMWYMSNGNHYDAIFNDPVNTSLTWEYKLDLQRSYYSTQFAWAVMAGVSYDFTNNTAVDIGYRYLDMGKYKNSLGDGSSKENKSQDVRIGLRYTPDLW